jgi:hypothetical protein
MTKFDEIFNRSTSRQRQRIFILKTSPLTPSTISTSTIFTQIKRSTILSAFGKHQGEESAEEGEEASRLCAALLIS